MNPAKIHLECGDGQLSGCDMNAEKASNPKPCVKMKCASGEIRREKRKRSSAFLTAARENQRPLQNPKQPSYHLQHRNCHLISTRTITLRYTHQPHATALHLGKKNTCTFSLLKWLIAVFSSFHNLHFKSFEDLTADYVHTLMPQWLNSTHYMLQA